jgi:iron complex outermembrane receptor protein
MSKNRYQLVLLLQAGSIALTVAAPAIAAEIQLQEPAAPQTQAESAAPAQQAQGMSASPTTDTLDTVVVTAQKREEKLQEVPIAVTAFSARQLETRGIDNVLDLNALGPGLQVSKTPSNSTISQISVRGITEINPAIYWDPAVGIYLDGVYIGKAQGSVFDVVDLNRIEVLRGPQGTLYGRNTVAGAINLVTNQPTGEFGVTNTLEVGNYNALVNKLSVDLPKFGIASISLGARSEQRDGWVTGTSGSSASELNNRKSNGLRLGANLAFTPTFQADYRFDHSDVDQNPAFAQLYRVNPAYWGAYAFFPPPFTAFAQLPSYVSKDRQTVANINAPVFEKSRVQGHSLTLTWNVNDSNTVKSISAYRHLDWSDSLDLDGSPLDIAFTRRFTKYHEWSQELQWVGHSGPLNYVGGLYYFTDDGFTNNPQEFFASSVLYDSEYGTHTKAGAAYAQLDYKVIDPLTLSAGIRYTEEKKELDRIFGCNAPFVPQDAANCTPGVGQSFNYLIPAGTHESGRFEAATPTFAVDYKINEHANVYARYAYGFKSGGFNGEFSDPTLPAVTASQDNINETGTPFKPEKQKSLELGAKTNFLDNRVQASAAIFQNKAKDLQESIFVASGAAATVVRNAGKATIRGLELEGAVVPVKGTTVRANYAWLDPKYDEFLVDVDADSDPNTPPVKVNAANNRAFVHAPRNAFNVVVDTRLARFDWGTVSALADYSYTSSIYTYPYQLSATGTAGNAGQQLASDSQVKAYGLLNLRLSLSQVQLGRAATGEVALWCRNCANEGVAANFIDFGPGFGSLTNAYFIDPVTYGITGIIRW